MIFDSLCNEDVVYDVLYQVRFSTGYIGELKQSFSTKRTAELFYNSLIVGDDCLWKKLEIHKRSILAWDTTWKEGKNDN